MFNSIWLAIQKPLVFIVVKDMRFWELKNIILKNINLDHITNKDFFLGWALGHTLTHCHKSILRSYATYIYMVGVQIICVAVMNVFIMVKIQQPTHLFFTIINLEEHINLCTTNLSTCKSNNFSFRPSAAQRTL